MNWTITDNLAGEVTEVQIEVPDGGDQPLFRFTNDRGDEIGVQLTDGSYVVGTWKKDGEFIKLLSLTDDRLVCGHTPYGDTRNCAEMICWNYTMKNRENW